MDSTPRRCWIAADRDHLLMRTWGRETVVYHVGSGNTHLLNPAAAAGLIALQESPADLETLTARVAAHLGMSADANLRDQLAVLVFELERLCLVQRVDDIPATAGPDREAT